jgi:hypothetical protein
VTQFSAKAWFSALLLVVSVVLLFARLGHYALWDDEALVALAAKGILRTGDTTAVLDDNIVAYSDGKLLTELRDRYHSPLPSYLAAASMTVFGGGTWALRLPFALCGLAWIVLVTFWLKRDNADRVICLLVIMGILGNVSLFLFFRQCRYYAPAILSATVVVFLYLHWKGRRRTLLWMAFWSLALLASNYMVYAEICLCLLVDYFFWGRKRMPLKVVDCLWLGIPQVLLGLPVVVTWNTLRAEYANTLSSVSPGHRALTIWWSFRDVNACEFGILALLVIAPILFFLPWPERAPEGLNRQWFLRLPLALGICTIAANFLSPMNSTIVAEVRYLAVTIPMWIVLAVLVIWRVTQGRMWFAIALGALAFGCNFLNGAWMFGHPARPVPLGCSPAKFVRELLSPPTDPYTVAARWINDHVPAHASIWVIPDYMRYPLMYHAPAPLYAWQLVWPPAGQFRNLPPIHFAERLPPDYVLAFGPSVELARNSMRSFSQVNVAYEPAALLDIYCLDTFRPELFLHDFEPVTNFDRNTEAVYAFRRTR